MGWGDEIMVTGIARRLQERDPRPVRVLDKKGRPRWSDVWRANPRMAGREFTGRVQTVANGPGLRPYVERETSARWIWRDWICPVGEIHLDAHELAFASAYAGRVLLEPRLKAEASPNKNWGWERWAELARRLRRDGHAVGQFAEPGAMTLPGVEAIRTPSFRAACAVLARARLAVLPEGGLHHAAAAMGTPTTVIFGGFISPRQTGYLHQVNLFTGGTPCGMRRRCGHCELAMRRITIEEVLAKARMLTAATADAAL